METSLHEELKKAYADDDVQCEVKLGRHRIDAISQGRLIEVQISSLSAIRDKIKLLVKKHSVVVVKPIIVRKTIIKRSSEDGPVASRRLSPKRGTIIDLFDELVHFTTVFPHRRLTLEVPMIDIEEWRYPGHGKRRRWRENDYIVEDQKLTAIHKTYKFHTADDLVHLIDCSLPTRFHSGHLAESMQIKRWVAQRIAYCLRRTGAVRETGKQGNARLYEFASDKKVA